MVAIGCVENLPGTENERICVLVYSKLSHYRCRVGAGPGHPLLVVEVEPALEVGVPEEQVWLDSFGWPQFGHVGGGGKLLWTIPMTSAGLGVPRIEEVAVANVWEETIVG